MDFSELFLAYQRNVWPAMIAHLAEQLGVSADSLRATGIGWIPLDACWVFPERDAEGQIIGLLRRFKDGKKFCLKGSERGLTYAVQGNCDQVGYVPGSQNWTRCSEEFPCPICGKEDWCLLSSENPTDPKAVICGRKAEGAKQALGEAGYLHIRKASGQVSVAGTILSASSLPILIVEGQSDVAAAFDLGFVAIGKPSAEGGNGLLADLMIGRDVVVIGENDAGAGRKGMEKTFEALKPRAKSIVKLMPPEGIKDLRAWYKTGLTQADLKKAIDYGSTTSDSDLLESTAPLDLADRWLRERHWQNGIPILRTYAGQWHRFDGTKYARVDAPTYVRGDIYAFLRGKNAKKTTKDGVNVVPFEATAHEVSDLMDALTMTCPIYVDPPCWLDEADEGRSMPDLVSFSNGILTLPDLVLLPATPRFFSLSAMPYAWDTDATCKRWPQFLSEVFPNDPEKINLLQEWFGYNMVADTSQEKLMFFVGRPGTGKGTVLEALRAVLGSGQVASTSFDTLVGDFGLQPLLGKLAAILPDAHITRRGDPSKALQVLKEISGRDGVGVNRKNKEFLADHKLSCRFTISVNAMPDLPDHERSLDRRLLLLHFGESFSGREDTTLKDKIAAEAPGIAAWAIQGLLRLRANGFTAPLSSVAVVEEFRKQSSPVSEFVDEYCEVGSYQTPVLMVYDAYAHWAKDQGVMVGSMTRFTQRILLLCPGITTGRMMHHKNQVRCYDGIKLTDIAIERYLVGRR